MMLNDVAFLSHHIYKLYQSPCQFSHSVTVRQVYKDRVLWEGLVGVFHMRVCSETVECYAWLTDTLQGNNIPVAFLQSEMVNSPAGAVRAYILELSQALIAA